MAMFYVGCVLAMQRADVWDLEMKLQPLLQRLKFHF
jgi:hypothetical protein